MVDMWAYKPLQAAPSNSLFDQALKSSLALGRAWGVEQPEPHQAGN